MRIIHLSDLHFGTEVPGLLEKLTDHIHATPADLTVISGDFTQTASRREFRNARNFLTSLQMPYFCVPGNHDIPRADIVERMLNPYARYKHYICPTLVPEYHAPDICIAGLNTARRILPHWNWAHGAIRAEQMTALERCFQKSGAAVKICVMHHPLQAIEGTTFKTIIFGKKKALKALSDMKVDLVLTGHVHHGAATVMDMNGHETLFLSASTALSLRLRQSSNGYNVITISEDHIRAEIFTFMEEKFNCINTIDHNLRKDRP